MFNQEELKSRINALELLVLEMNKKLSTLEFKVVNPSLFNEKEKVQLNLISGEIVDAVIMKVSVLYDNEYNYCKRIYTIFDLKHLETRDVAGNALIKIKTKK